MPKTYDDQNIIGVNACFHHVICIYIYVYIYIYVHSHTPPLLRKSNFWRESGLFLFGRVFFRNWCRVESLVFFLIHAVRTGVWLRNGIWFSGSSGPLFKIRDCNVLRATCATRYVCSALHAHPLPHRPFAFHFLIFAAPRNWDSRAHF